MQYKIIVNAGIVGIKQNKNNGKYVRVPLIPTNMKNIIKGMFIPQNKTFKAKKQNM